MFSYFGSDTLATLLLVLFVLQYRRIATFLNLSKYRMRRFQWTPAPREEVPEHTRHLLDCAAEELAGLGFKPIRTEAAEPPNVCDPRARMYSDLYWQPEHSVFARVDLAEPLSGQVTKAAFLSLFEDGGMLETVNRAAWANLPTPKEIRVVDAYRDNLAGQWQAHRDALAEETARRVPVADQAESSRRKAVLGFPLWLARGREVGWLREESPGDWRFTAKGAWAYSGQMLRLFKQAHKTLASPYHHQPAPDLHCALRAEMDSTAAVIALAAQPAPAWVKTALFALTLALSALLFWGDFSSMDALALLAVLLVHELGHLAAMWAFDYRNLSIFFLPFLGAAAVGHKPHAPPWQEAIVLLAGPVPGLALALAATQISSEALPLPVIEFLRTWVFLSLAINLFNLLPFGVLDGGRLFELAVLGRFPHARAAFVGLGVALGLLYAYWNESMAMGAAMALLLFSLPIQFKTARIIKAIRAKIPPGAPKSLSGAAAIQALGQAFAEAGYGKTSAKGWQQRVDIARLAYPRLLQGVPGFGMSFGVLATQGLVLLGTLVLVVWHLQEPGPTSLMRSTLAEVAQREKEQAEQREKSPESQAENAAWEQFVARYQAKTDPEKQWAMLSQDEDDDAENPWAYAANEPSRVKWLDQQRAALLDRLPSDHPGRLAHELAQAWADPAQAGERLTSAIDRLTADGARKAVDLDQDRFTLLMGLYGRLADEAPVAVAKSRVAAMEAVWADLDSPAQKYAQHRSKLASTLAHIAASAGETGAAETWMARTVATTPPESANYAALAQAWFWLDIGRYDQALGLANQTLATLLPEEAHFASQWRAVAGWAEMGRGHPREADAFFQAVLSERAERVAQIQQDSPVWMRVLTWRLDRKVLTQQRIDPATLDHLAALDAYDPPAAARLLAELAEASPLWKQRHGGRWDVYSRYEGWGKAREAAHGRLLQALEASGQMAGGTTTAAKSAHAP